MVDDNNSQMSENDSNNNEIQSTDEMIVTDVNTTIGDENIVWHTAFFQALQIELIEYRKSSLTRQNIK